MPKRKCCFKEQWSQELDYIKKSHIDDFHAFCSLCRTDIDISSKGKGEIERHALTDKHRRNVKSAGASSLSSFFPPVGSPLENKITAAELTKVYHSVKHHQSYKSVDCEVKVDREIFNDSAIAKGITCGKTKAQAMCENVLAPYSVEKHTKYIKDNELPFSLASDASNKGTTKCFPIMLRYFHFDKGVQNVLLNFYSDSDETSAAITNQLLTKIEESGLDLNKVSAYTADNASVNYGRHNSVYQKLKLAQEDVIAANCLAHILHNATRHAAGCLNVDVENAVLKVYSHFSVSATRTAQLQEFCEFLEVSECNLLRHVVTRWLSLLPAIDRILKYWAPLRSYFRSLGQENCNKVVWKCFGDEGNSSDLAEIYFLFLSHTLKLFCESIEALEAKAFSVTSVFGLMSDLHRKLKMRHDDHFFGHVANTKLRQLTPDQTRKCDADFTTFYARAIKYLGDRYDFKDSSLHSKISKLDLSSDVPFEEFSAAVQACKLKDINMDDLYEEYGTVKASLSSPEMTQAKSEERYLKLLKKKDVPLPNLKKVSAYIFSIPCSNAHTERVFSMMKTTWRDERNRLEIDSVQAELQICINYTEDCTDMYKVFLSERRLLEAARKSVKYKK